MVVKQNGKARVVMTGGNIIAEFMNGTADVDKAAADVLAALGYEVVPEVVPEDEPDGGDGSQAETKEQTNGTDADGEASDNNSGNKRSGRGKSA